MMSSYMTEEEQIEHIKKWWEKYNTWIITTLSIVLIVLSGYKYWHWHQEKITLQASNYYEQLMKAVAVEDEKSIKAYAHQLSTEYHGTVYADGATLALAKYYVEHGNLNQALPLLENLTLHASIDALKQLAALRKARLFIAQKAYDKAQAELQRFNYDVYGMVADELRGDILAAQDNKPKALVFYQKALKATTAAGLDNPYLSVKTQALKASTAKKS